MTIDRPPCPCRFCWPLLPSSWSPLRQYARKTLIHYTVNGTDNSTWLRAQYPTPARLAMALPAAPSPFRPISHQRGASGLRHRSFGGGGAAGVLAPGTKQLNNMAINNAGGFTYETWFKWNGSGNINAVIDYAVPRSLFSRSGQTAPRLQYYDTNNSPVTDSSTPPVQPMALRRGGVHRDRAGHPYNLTGNFTFYLDAKAPIGSVSGVTISQFGDNLNRRSRGHAPAGFSGDFFNGLITNRASHWGRVRLQPGIPTKCVRLPMRRFRRGFPAGRRCQCEQWPVITFSPGARRADHCADQRRD